MSYNVGDVVKCQATFTHDGVAVDPDTVTFRVQDPTTGVIAAYVYGTDPEIVRDSQGNYTTSLVVTSPGVWHYRYEATGDYQSAEEDAFTAQPAPF